MKRLFLTLALLAASPAIAQDNMAQADTPALPEICLAGAAAAPSPMAGMEPMTAAADAAHGALMAGMDRMNADMTAGAAAADIDVAFICSMIPHHRGAIDMAKAELQYGNDPWAKGLAEKIIAAQEQEIADMLKWLSEQPK